jgi:hypothetical protein
MQHVALNPYDRIAGADGDASFREDTGEFRANARIVRR